MTLAMREVVLAFRRAPVLAVLSITTIAFSLFAFGLFGLVALNIRSALREIEDRVEVRAFLVEGTSEEAVEDVMAAALRMPQVASAGYVSPDSALQRARAELSEFRDVIDGSVLPGSVEVRLKPDLRDPDRVKEVSNGLAVFPAVEEVRYGREWVEKLYRIRTIAGIAGMGLGIVLALVATIIIGATIRMAILARTREIEIMRLVGATNGFVRFPYLIDGVLKGVLGGILATLLAWGANSMVSRNLVATQFFDSKQILLGIVAGALLGLIGSWISVGRHLRQVWRD
ncbi:MAG TPA: permease-like cell division protein FtsX [Gemmatimonas sp.]|nr:permease-like cell division protein FtsX [Gemmatimonas sp.]